MTKRFDPEQFKRDRNAALLSLDMLTIREYLRKYGEPMPYVSSEEVFWAGIHKARTACRDLPMAARSESKRWLRDHGYHAEDDGDVPMPHD